MYSTIGILFWVNASCITPLAWPTIKAVLALVLKKRFSREATSGWYREIRDMSELYKVRSLTDVGRAGLVVMAVWEIRKTLPFSSLTTAIPVMAMPGSIPRTSIQGDYSINIVRDFWLVLVYNKKT